MFKRMTVAAAIEALETARQHLLDVVEHHRDKADKARDAAATHLAAATAHDREAEHAKAIVGRMAGLTQPPQPATA